MPQSHRDPLLDLLDDVQRDPKQGDPLLSMLDDVQGVSADKRSIGSRAFDAVFTPPEAVTAAFKAGADRIDSPSLDRSPMRARLEGFAAGAWEGVGSLITPGDVVLTATGFGPLARAVRGVRGGARAVDTLQRGVNLATAGRGVERVADAESASDAAAGVAQVALGAAGAKTPPSRPQGAPTPRAALPPGPRFVSAPDGRVAPAGTDIPMSAAPDGSYVRGVPAEYARREISGLLPAAREPLITPPPPGSVPDASDPSFVRGVPGEYARREIRGELPPGPRFHVDGAGNVAPAERVDELLQMLDDVQGRGRSDPSGVRSVPAAVAAREIDPTVPAKRGITSTQFFSDPDAIDAPWVSDDEVRMLRTMREDLDIFTPQRGRLITDPADAASTIYARGGAGSPVGDDIRVISEQNVGNREIAQAIEDLLAGKRPTNRLHTAAIDAAKGYLEGRPGYRGPHLPMEALDDAGTAVGARAGAGDARTADVDDFEQFSRIFDDAAPDGSIGGREPGEEGFITTQLAAHVGGGAGGAAFGAATGEDETDRLKRAALFGAAGAVAPSLFRRGGGQAAARIGAGAQDPATMADGDGPRGVVSGPARTGRPRTDPMDGMDVFIGKFNPMVQSGIRERISANGGYDMQRRGTIDSRTLGRFANEIRINVEKTLPRGTALNAESVTAYARAVQQTQTKINELAQRVSAGTATDADIVALQAARADADVLTKSLAGARSEAGRSLAAFRFLGGVLETGDVNLIRGVADSLRDEARQLAEGLAQQPNDPLVRYRWLQAQNKPTLWSKFRSMYYANILSGVKTHERNILGNVANIASELVVTPAAAAADVVRSKVTGTPRTVYLDEVPSGVVGAIAGMERGWADMWFTLREGVSPDSLRRTLSAGETGKLDVPRVEFGGGAANPFNWPGRALDGADTFFRSVAKNKELYQSAHTQAKREGLTGDRLAQRMAELRAGLTADAQALHEQAAEYARRAVFQEKPGRLTSWVMGLNNVPGAAQVMPFVLPFVKTPSNIFKQGLEFSPAGVFMKAARQGGRAGAQAQGRAIAGSFAAGYLAWLAATGRLSGNGPSDRAERAALMESGWRPNSVRIGDSWVGYQLFQPVSVQAAIIANAFEAWKEGGSQPDGVADAVSRTLARSANSFLDQSFFAGMFDFVEALREPEFSAPRFVARAAQGVVPFVGAARTAQQAMDPVVRQPKGAAESFKAALPGLSDDVQPRIGRGGEVVIREGGPLRRAADPFNVSSTVDDPVAKEIDRLVPIAESFGLTGWPLGLPSDRYTSEGAPLSRTEETELKSLRGSAAWDAVTREINRPRYRRMPDEKKARTLDKLIDRARQRVSTDFRRDVTRRRRGDSDVEASTGEPVSEQVYRHPRFGRVQVVAAGPNDSVRVRRADFGGSRQYVVRSEDLMPIAVAER
jgi:hypothetical protein